MRILEEAALHLRKMREADKDVWDNHRRVHTTQIMEGDLVLLHDTKPICIRRSFPGCWIAEELVTSAS